MRIEYRGLMVGMAFLAGGCGPPQGGGPAGSGILIIAVDGLRADHLSTYGYDRATSPNLDLLAEEGVIYENTWTAAPKRLPAHISLLTGCDPILSRRYAPAEFEGHAERRWNIPGASPHLATEFLANGYATAAFLDAPELDRFFGFGPGFQGYTLAGEGEFREKSHTAGHSARLLQWLRSQDRSRPWFAYLHLADLERSWGHPDPRWERYFPPREGLEEIPPVGMGDAVLYSIPYSRWHRGSRTIAEYEAHYDGHIRKLDEELGELLAGLRRQGRFEETTICLVGTYGLQFGEDGLVLAAGRYSRADLHVPWILRPRRSLRAAHGIHSASLASLVDVAPTLLELERIVTPREMRGRSQAAVLFAGGLAIEERPAVFASSGIHEGCVALGSEYNLEILVPGLADLRTRRSWYGDLRELDPEPQIRFYARDSEGRRDDPQAGAEAEVELRRALDLWVEEVEARALRLRGDDGFRVFDPATEERLRAEGILEADA